MTDREKALDEVEAAMDSIPEKALDALDDLSVRVEEQFGHEKLGDAIVAFLDASDGVRRALRDARDHDPSDDDGSDAADYEFDE